MFSTYYQTSEQSYLLNYGNFINIETNKKVLSHFKFLQKKNYKFIKNIIPSFNKLIIQFDPYFKKETNIIINELKNNDHIVSFDNKIHKIEICYDDEYALDKNIIEKILNISFADFINLHLKIEFHVFMIGFMPGLPFLGVSNFKKNIPRLISPRLKIPSGSVGVVNNLTVIYPNECPGGWNIIGKTKKNLFINLNTFFSPGDKVIFKKISKKYFLKK